MEKKGRLVGLDGHTATGDVRLSRNQRGQFDLWLVGLDMSHSPDPRVYLCKDGNRLNGVELGKLDSLTGSVQFLLPAGLDPSQYNSVVVWCAASGTGLGCANFPV